MKLQFSYESMSATVGKVPEDRAGANIDRLLTGAEVAPEPVVQPPPIGRGLSLDVGAAVDRFALRLFGGPVERRPQNHVRRWRGTAHWSGAPGRLLLYYACTTMNMPQLDVAALRQPVQENRCLITRHAQQRMGLRKITHANLKYVIATGDVVEQHPGNQPDPKAMFMALLEGEPLYEPKVFARNAEGNWTPEHHPQAAVGRRVVRI